MTNLAAMDTLTLGRATYKLPYINLLPALSEGEYAALRTDIIERGIVVPIVIDDDGNVIDGHHRLRIAAELELTDFPQEIRTGMSAQEQESLALDLNLHRRHLSREQRDQVIVWRRRQGESTRQIAEAVGVSEKTVRNALMTTWSSTAENSAVELPTVIKGKDGKPRPAQRPKVRTESVKDTAKVLGLLAEAPDLPDVADVRDVKQAVKEKKRQEREAARIAPPMNDAPIPARLICESIADACDDKSIVSNIDVLITDPPYPREYLHVYESLAVFASRMLKPGGSLLQ